MSTPPRNWVIQVAQITQTKYDSQYIPYAAGLIQAFAMRHASSLSRYTFLPIMVERLPLTQNLLKARMADVIGFSVYTWNCQYSLALARELKAVKPEILTVFGGPHVPDLAEAWLRKHPQVDVAVHGEGESVFLEIIESLPEKDWSEIAGISYLDAEGKFHFNPRRPRRKDLSDIPSPYLMGVFDDLLRNTPYRWTALWETNRGCPFTCTYCDWGSAIGTKVAKFDMERIKAEIDWFARNKIEIVSSCDANYGMLKRDIEITDWMVEAKAQTGYPQIFYVQGAKNVTERIYEVQSKLIKAHMTFAITLSLQSTNPVALKNVRRENISLETYRELQHRFSADGVETYSDMLIGLPGETYDTFADNISDIMARGQHFMLRYYNVFLLPNSEMSQPAYREKFGLQTVFIPYHEAYSPIQMEVEETQEMLIGHDELNLRDWRRVRMLAWWTEILHFKIRALQLPAIVLHELAGLSYRQIYEYYAEGPIHNAPMIQALRDFFERKARAIQAGEEHHLCAHMQNDYPMWLHVDDFIMQGISDPQIVQDFYRDHYQVIGQMLVHYGKKLPEGMLEDMLRLAQALYASTQLKQLFDIEVGYNLWDLYMGVRQNKPWELKKGRFRYVRDWVGPPMHTIREEPTLPRAGALGRF